MSTPRRPRRPDLTVNELRKLLAYDPETGALTWLVSRSGNAQVGQRAGYLKPDGYRVVNIGPRAYPAQNLAFALHHNRWPEKIIDHDDGDRDNNRPGNMVEAGYSQNNRNRVRVSRTGFRGVTRSPRTLAKPFQATIAVNGKSKHLGMFATAEEAARAYDAAVLEHCGPRFPTNASLGFLK